MNVELADDAPKPSLKNSSGELLEFSKLSGDSCSSTSSTHSIVRQTLKDVIDLQHNAMQLIRDTAERQKLNYVLKATYDEMVRKYDNERLEHEKTRLLLEKETEKLEFALGEIEILSKHLEKEKKKHEEVIVSVKQKATRESQRSDHLHNKCTEIQHTIQRQKDDLCLKDNEISSLKQRLKLQRESHRRLLDDIELQKVQEQYMARSLGDKENSRRKGAS